MNGPGLDQVNETGDEIMKQKLLLVLWFTGDLLALTGFIHAALLFFRICQRWMLEEWVWKNNCAKKKSPWASMTQNQGGWWKFLIRHKPVLAVEITTQLPTHHLKHPFPSLRYTAASFLGSMTGSHLTVGGFTACSARTDLWSDYISWNWKEKLC